MLDGKQYFLLSATHYSDYYTFMTAWLVATCYCFMHESIIPYCIKCGREQVGNKRLQRSQNLKILGSPSARHSFVAQNEFNYWQGSHFYSISCIQLIYLLISCKFFIEYIQEDKNTWEWLNFRSSCYCQWHLKESVKAALTYLMTQMFWENTRYTRDQSYGAYVYTALLYVL